MLYKVFPLHPIYNKDLSMFLLCVMNQVTYISIIKIIWTESASPLQDRLLSSTSSLNFRVVLQMKNPSVQRFLVCFSEK